LGGWAGRAASRCVVAIPPRGNPSLRARHSARGRPACSRTVPTEAPWCTPTAASSPPPVLTPTPVPTPTRHTPHPVTVGQPTPPVARHDASTCHGASKREIPTGEHDGRRTTAAPPPPPPPPYRERECAPHHGRNSLSYAMRFSARWFSAASKPRRASSSAARATAAPSCRRPACQRARPNTEGRTTHRQERTDLQLDLCCVRLGALRLQPGARLVLEHGAQLLVDAHLDLELVRVPLMMPETARECTQCRGAPHR
jgi:hypothetical protein